MINSFFPKSIGACFNDKRTERYSLWRIWDNNKPLLLFVCLNPSTADESNNDPTVTRCMNYAAVHEYGGLYVCNLFPLMSTDPKALYKVDPYSKHNEGIVLTIRQELVDDCIVAWGNHGMIGGHGIRMANLLSPVKCFGVNKSGMPKHPLYLPKSTPLINYKGEYK